MDFCIKVLVALALQHGATFEEVESICKTNPTCIEELRAWQAKDQDRDQQTPNDSRTTGSVSLGNPEIERCRLHKG